MSDFLEKMRQKPEGQKIKIMWLAVVVFSGIVLFFWLVNFKSSIPSAGPIVPQDKNSDTAISAIDKLAKQLPSFGSALSASFQTLKELISGSSTQQAIVTTSTIVSSSTSSIQSYKIPQGN